VLRCRGVAFGYIVYLTMTLFTGEYITNIQYLWDYYTNPANYKKMLNDLKPTGLLGGELPAEDSHADEPVDTIDVETNNPIHRRGSVSSEGSGQQTSRPGSRKASFSDVMGSIMSGDRNVD
jgi:hypothetical protein